MKQYWLMKSEPGAYSIDDLSHDGKAPWEGVRNYQARNFMRDNMQEGDNVIFYHSSVTPPAAVGEGIVCSKAYPDASQFNKKSSYYDPKSTKEKPIWHLVDICYVSTFDRAVPLQEIRRNPKLCDMLLVVPGSRLSVMPIAAGAYREIVAMSKHHERGLKLF